MSLWILLFGIGLTKGGIANLEGLKEHFKHNIHGMKETEVKKALI